MSPELHQRVRGIFDQALARPEGERRQFLQDICGADPETFQAVERLLEAHRETSFFLDQTSPGARRLGRYIVSRELGRGAMGIVYEATDPLIGRTVAVKTILLQTLSEHDDGGFLRERLLREARSAGSLSHPGIVTIFDVGEENDVAFIAMERVNGPSLQQLLTSSRRLDFGRAVEILRQAGAALDYAHQKGVIHRDVKPANIMLHEGSAVKITDFGIAKILSAVEQTRTGLVMGTPSYMSPEQIGAKSLDGRSDQFSLAAVAFQLLTGTEAFWAESVATLLQKILYGPRPSARALNPALPPGVDKVLQRGLEKSPVLRYGTCTEFVTALDKAAQGAPAPRVPADNRNSLTETLTVGIEPLKPDAAAGSGGFKRSIRAFGGAVAVIAAVGCLVYFSRTFPPQPTTPVIVTEPLKPEPPPVAAETKPSPLAPVSLPPVEPANPPPKDDKSARARQYYTDAIKYRNAKEEAKAIDLFRQAANLGDIRAMVELGETLLNDSDGATSDYPEALLWLRKAADAGNPAGMVELGGMYLLGNGVDEDFDTAAQWFRKAAAAGSPAAMYNLGTMYENGQGVVEDRDKAKQLFTQAADLGNQAARKRLADFEQ